MANEIYNLFEVDSDASVEAIKRSYTKLVRKHKQNNVEIFTLITQAKDTLCNPRTRAIYDSLQHLTELLEAYGKETSFKNWENAINILKRVSLEKPEEDEIQHLLKVFPCINDILSIYDLQCRTEDYYIEGQIYRHQANLLTSEDHNRKRLYQLARESFEQSITRNSSNSKPYVAIAQTYLKENDYSTAVDWAEKAINADGKVDFQDFEALHFLCMVYASSGELQKIETQVQKISALLSSPEAQSYAFSQFSAYGEELYQTAFELLKQSNLSDQIHLFQASLAFKRAARIFNPNDEEIERECSKLEDLVSAVDQFEKIEKDILFPESFQKLVALCMFDCIDIENSSSERNDLFNSIIAEIVMSSELSEVAILIERLKSQYSKIYQLGRKVFDRVQAVSQEPSKQKFSLPLQASELLNRVSYQDFMKTIRDNYFHKTNTFRENIDHTTNHLSSLLEPITEKFVERYENSQFSGLEYQNFIEALRNRSAQDTVLLRERIKHVHINLYNFLNPIAEKIILTYPHSRPFFSPLIEKLSNITSDESD